MPEPTYQIADLVNVGSLRSALLKSKSYSEYYTDQNAFADIRSDNNRLKFYTKEELDKEVTAEEATVENPAYAPVPAAIVDLPREQFLDELSFEASFNFATWNTITEPNPEADPVVEGEYKIEYGETNGYGDYEDAYGMVADEEDDDDRSKDTSDLDGKPVIIFKYHVQNPITDDDASDGQTITYTETYTFIDLSEIMSFKTATNEEVADMLDEVFPELA